MAKRNNKRNFKKEEKHKINNKIYQPEVRVVGDGEPKIMKTKEAIDLAYSKGLDLILINEKQSPPIAKMEDYGKFLYKQSQAEKERKKNSVKTIVKEVQLSPNIGDNDLSTKVKQATKFLEKNNKVKCTLLLKGREKATPERGQIIMLKFATLIEEVGKIEDMPRLQGNKWLMMIKPIK